MVKLRLIEISKKLGKNATDIARDTGINRNTINTLMKEGVEDVRLSTLEKICDTYGLELSDILGVSLDNEKVKSDKHIGKI